MSNQNNISKIKLSYYKGLVNEDELEMYKLKLSEIDIKLIEYDKSYIPMACLEDFTNQVSLMISSPIVQTITSGIITNTSYDLLKGTIIWMWNSLSGKKLTRVTSNGSCESKEVTFGFSVSINKEMNLDFRLSGNVSEEDKSKCIDKAFEILKERTRQISSNKLDFAKYDQDKKQWILFNTNEEIRKSLENQNVNC